MWHERGSRKDTVLITMSDIKTHPNVMLTARFQMLPARLNPAPPNRASKPSKALPAFANVSMGFNHLVYSSLTSSMDTRFSNGMLGSRAFLAAALAVALAVAGAEPALLVPALAARFAASSACSSCTVVNLRNTSKAYWLGQ